MNGTDARVDSPAEESLEAMLGRQCGVLTTAQASRHVGRDAVRWRVRRGWWQRPHRGVLVAQSGPLAPEQVLWVNVLRAGAGAVLAGPTAAALAGLRGYEDPRYHLLLPAGRTPADQAGLAIHRIRALGPEDLQPVLHPPRTRLPRSLVDAARWAATPDRACAVLAAGVQQRLARPADLRAVLQRMPTARRRALLLRTLDAIDGGAHSLAEIHLVRLCRREGLPEPEQQVARRDRAGRRRWLDAYWSRWGVHVEIDGAAHLDVRVWWQDMQRQNEVWLRGDRILRFPAYLLRTQPTVVADTVRIALTAAGWTSP